MEQRLLHVARDINRRGIALGFPLEGPPERFAFEKRKDPRASFISRWRHSKPAESFELDKAVPVLKEEPQTLGYRRKTGRHPSGDFVTYYVEE